MITRQRLRKLIEDVELTHVAQAIEALVRPALRLCTGELEEGEIPLGATKLGGQPDLPPHVAWPKWNTTPLAFLAQIDLDLAGALDESKNLPSQGRLYFFCAHDGPGEDFSEPERWRVFYDTSPVSDLVRVAWPEGLERGFGAQSVTLQTEVTLPPTESLVIEQLGLNEDDLEQYWELEARAFDDAQDFGDLHRLLGYPDAFQGDMQLQCYRVSQGLSFEPPDESEWVSDEIRDAASKWQLLLQLDNDAQMKWGESGIVYFWIHQDDLEAGNFDRVLATTQFY